MLEFSKHVSSAWENLSAEEKEAHTKQVGKFADGIMKRVSSEWRDLSSLSNISSCGDLTSQMLWRELEKRGCEVKQSKTSRSGGWEVRKRPA